MMTNSAETSVSPPETVATVRNLYRSSEARAARLRLLIEAGRDLAAATRETLDDVLAQSARQAAHFSGHVSGEVVLEDRDSGIPLIAPGPAGFRVGTLLLQADTRGASGLDKEDSDALDLLAQLIAATIQRVAHDEEREKLLSALKEREKRLEHVVERLFSAQEDERRRVSGELHDSVAQTAGALFRRLETRSLSQDERSGEEQELAAIAQGLVRELRRVIAGLRPTALDDLGLAAALSGLADGLRDQGFDVDFNTVGYNDWPPNQAIAFFRVGQEALANISKYAGGPCRVEIDLVSDPARGLRRLRVRDFGKGFSAEANPATKPGEQVGLKVMQERMMAIGGQLEVTSETGGGVAVTASVEDRP